MNKGIKTIVYSVKDLVEAKKLYTTFLGVEPYADSAYYVGYKLGDLEIGLANGQSNGPIVYMDVEDIKASLQELVTAGAQVEQDVKQVAPGLLVASVKDTNSNVIGLRQFTK